MTLQPKVIVSVSGGKDSTATCLYLQDLGIPFDPIFMDVGWDNLATYAYLREELPRIIGSIKWLRQEVPLVAGYETQTLEIEAMLGISPSAMVRTCVYKGVFPSRVMRWCTEQLKVVPAIQYFAANKSDDVVIVNAIGVRRAESRARSQLTEFEWSAAHGGVLVWRPLIDWTEDQVIEIHRRHGVKPNPNYLNGASRVGCWPCIFARKDEIRRIAETDPNRIEAMRRLEAVVVQRARDRRLRAGKTPMTDPSWFQNPMPEKKEDGTRDGSCWPIDRVVSWSKTARGGRQFELFTLPDSEAGCFRWGMCETPQ
jgi:3'-phosphoadenosine 5'-phosphosulfate sulfotransferase (PAPS reductase)/FAD synthetase